MSIESPANILENYSNCMSSKKDPSVFRTIFSYFAPITAAFLLQQAYSLADGLVLGRMVGSKALAAVSGSNNTIINLVITFFAGLSSGPMVLTAQAYGRNDRASVKRTISNAMVLSLVVGFIFFLLIFVFAQGLHRVLETPEELIPDAVRYLRWYFIGMIPTLIFNMGSNVMRSLGETKKPLYFLIVCTVLNIGLDVLFVQTFADGILGVAVASGLSQAVSAVLILLSLTRLDPDIRLTPANLIVDKTDTQKSLKIGLPTALQNSMYFVTSLLISSAINRLGTNSIASWAIFYKYDGLFWALSSSFNLAITSLSGQYYGARKNKELKECASKGVLAYLLVSVPFSVLLFAFRKYASALFTEDVTIIEEAAKIIGYIVLFYSTFVFTEILAAVIRGTGNTARPTLLTFASIFLLRLLLIFGVVMRMPSDLTISLCYVIPWIVSSLLFCLYYRFGAWLKPFSVEANNE